MPFEDAFFPETLRVRDPVKPRVYAVIKPLPELVFSPNGRPPFFAIVLSLWVGV
jgi:hypothetical protein